MLFEGPFYSGLPGDESISKFYKIEQNISPVEVHIGEGFLSCKAN